MSRFPQIQATPSTSSDQDGRGGGYLDRPPFSKAAVTGFVCSLLFFVPAVTQLLGLIFGVAGLVASRRGQRRGKGLAIAAIPISLLFMAAWAGLVGFAVLSFRATNAADREVMAALRASGDERERLFAGLYAERMSQRFRIQVDQEAFARWAGDVRAKHGQLQTVRRDQRKRLQPTATGAFEFNYVGEFVNGSAAIVIRYYRLLPDRAQVDNILVDGVAAAPN